ncbi:MAG: hypothetical protein IPH07_13680 [Deltaproteobacteria bacterium]|nr:hypothetical protein [Deltaproteobacteria bacterium]MBK8241208.1 hypothetical protein [Deltaproteobacteria bacterium]MBK8716868.1 hypothetical protein [Deltaproteobacteria bacterium]MBP7286974.1 hypothetical protein [Nannocystaceae bacterium]
MSRRVVVPRVSEGSVSLPDSPSTHLFEPPQLAALRIAFGVGASSGEPPDADSFRPTYTVSMPIFSMGGLDPDGVYEFDAGLLLDGIRRRALRRSWGVRLEIELSQAADSVPHADLWVDAPFDDDSGLTLTVLGRNARGITLPGGARTVVVATSLVHDSKRIALLGGGYTAQLRDIEPGAAERPRVASMVRNVHVDLTRFEFEG